KTRRPIYYFFYMSSADSVLRAISEEIQEGCPLIPEICNLVFEYLLPRTISEKEVKWLNLLLGTCCWSFYGDAHDTRFVEQEMLPAHCTLFRLDARGRQALGLLNEDISFLYVPNTFRLNS